MSSDAYVPSMYRDAVTTAAMSDPYPTLTGHAMHALWFIRTLNESPYAHTDTIRQVCDKFEFTTAYVHAAQFYACRRSMWTDENAEQAGRDYQRAAHDLIPADTNEVPF